MHKLDKRVLILMYHDIVKGDPINEYQRSIKDFECDIQYLIMSGYDIISFEILEKMIDQKEIPNNNCIIITFDDGCKSVYTQAYPILLKYKCPATLFIVSKWINRINFLNENDINSILKINQDLDLISFQSHTLSHPFLSKAKSSYTSNSEYCNFLHDELYISQKIISNLIKKPVKWLALPYGDGANDETIIEISKKLNYSGIRTSIWNSVIPTDADIFALPSLPILSNTNFEMNISKFIS